MAEYRIGYDDIIKASGHLISGTSSQFIPGETYIATHGAIIDSSDVQSLVECSLGRWYTEGKYSKSFQRKLREFFGSRVRGVTLCNSGSSANLLAITALTAEEFGSRRLRPGDEVITTALGFPTTVNAIIQNNAIPVFVDVDLHTFVPDPDVIEQAVNENTKAIVLAHPLGMAFDVGRIRDICDEYHLWLVEDCCDALGTTIDGELAGTFGDLATISFYPAHHITGGEGGAVLTQSPMVKKVVESFRDWGRDCWCLPGSDNTCGKRFDHEWGNLPFGYDHKYVYRRLGYNLKITDFQSALLSSQIERLPEFIDARRHNYSRLYDGLKKFDTYLRLPKVIGSADPSWFGFPITVKEFCSPFTRLDLVRYLEERGIGTRLFFAGNLIRHPAYKDVVYKQAEELMNTDIITTSTFWVGVWPGINDEMVDYMISVISTFIEERCNG